MLKYDQHYHFFLNICPFAEKLNNFEYQNLQNDFYHENNLNQMLVILLFYLILLLIQILLLMLLLFLFKSALFVNPAMSDLSINCFCFIFKSSFLFVNLLQSAVAKYLDLMSNTSAS